MSAADYRMILSDFLSSKKISFLAFICCLGYALFKTSLRDIGDIFQFFVVFFCVLVVISRWRYFLHYKYTWLLFFSILIPVFSWINSLFHIPDYAKDWPKLGEISYFLFFLFIAYWLKESKLRIFLFFLFFIAGCFLTFFIHSESILNDVLNGWNGNRVDFSYRNANHPAALAGAAFIVSVIYLFGGGVLEKNGFIKFAFWLFISLVSIFCIIITQSRQVWLAVFIAISLIFFYRFKLNKKTLLLFSLLLFAFFCFFSRVDFIEDRLAHESNLIPYFIAFDMDKIPLTSTGLRLHFVAESLPWIKSHPFIGLGFGAKELVITQSDTLPARIVREFRHLHNGHIEVIVNYGFIGYLIFYFIFLFVFFDIVKSGKSDYNVGFALFSGFLLYFIIINIFESFFSFKDGQYIFNCVVAGAYALAKNDYFMKKTWKGES